MLPKFYWSSNVCAIPGRFRPPADRAEQPSASIFNLPLLNERWSVCVENFPMTISLQTCCLLRAIVATSLLAVAAGPGLGEEIDLNYSFLKRDE